MSTTNHTPSSSVFQSPTGKSLRDSLDTIDRSLLNISILEDRIRLEKDCLPELVARLFKGTTLDEIPKLYKDLYWISPHIGGPVKRTFHKIIGGAAPVLHVHHRTYENRGWEHLHPEDLIVLCEDCHAKHHDVLPGADDA